VHWQAEGCSRLSEGAVTPGRTPRLVFHIYTKTGDNSVHKLLRTAGGPRDWVQLSGLLTISP
jgi:hypothetical protein